MPDRHHIAFLHRWVLALFMLSLGVAAASPLVHPRSLEVVCSSAGAIKVIVHTDDGAQEQEQMSMDCSLCAAAGAPPAVFTLQLPAVEVEAGAGCTACGLHPATASTSTAGLRGAVDSVCAHRCSHAGAAARAWPTTTFLN